MFSFLAQLSTNLQKMHYFEQFKDHNSGKKEIGQITPFFSSTFWAPTVCDIHFCIWKLPKFIFMGSSFRPFWSAKYLNFGGVSCEIRILSRLFPVAYTLRKVKNQVLLFLSSWEPNLSDLMVYFCLFQNAILYKVEDRVLTFLTHFPQNAVFIACNIFSVLFVICLSWNLRLKLSHEFLTFISFNIWR